MSYMETSAELVEAVNPASHNLLELTMVDAEVGRRFSAAAE